MKTPTVVVGMSGGVDSSVSAYLLKKQGFRVIGLFMKCWEETLPNGACHSEADYEDVLAVCHEIDIPCYSVNFVTEYRERVFEQFLADYKAGLTPNPDILCNREIKFKSLFQKALEIGGDYLATGHYCRVQNQSSQHFLLKGLDAGKDQSYFLYAISQKALSSTLFPIGHLEKSEVRAIARQAKIPTAEKKDSTGICFIGERKFSQFLQGYIKTSPGDLVTVEGKRVGTHEGAIFYTLGQRRGIGLGGEGEAWFVVDKDIQNNIVYVARGENHPALFSSELTASSLSWIAHPPIMPCRVMAKIRYRQKDVPCRVSLLSSDRIHVEFDAPERAITPGQSVVLYDQDITLGGGVIEKCIPPVRYTTHKHLQ